MLSALPRYMDGNDIKEMKSHMKCLIELHGTEVTQHENLHRRLQTNLIRMVKILILFDPMVKILIYLTPSSALHQLIY